MTSAHAVQTGLAALLDDGLRDLGGARVGLATQAAAVTPDLRGMPEALLAAGANLVALFGPEHGLGGAAEAGAQVGDSRDRRTGLPVHSLYGPTVRPTPEMLAGIDLMLFDMQDVGVRFYTYISTLRELLIATADAGIRLIVLDRPNPLGGIECEGPMLEHGSESFVGAAPVPIRHGLTIGEIALLLRARYRPDAPVEVVRMRGWQRSMWFEQTGLAWAPPSPNMPHLSTVLLYPGMCLLEGTNLSCGRGTALPFEWCGAPWVDGYALAERLNQAQLPGVRFRAARFMPLADRFAGQECGGVQAHVTDRDALRPVALGVHLVAALRHQHAGNFGWHAAHFDRLAGGTSLREAIERGDPPDAVAGAWGLACAAYLEARQAFLLYP
jgi:uncharacterized protein YbbC (DUF1343 family)